MPLYRLRSVLLHLWLAHPPTPFSFGEMRDESCLSFPLTHRRQEKRAEESLLFTRILVGWVTIS
jgi:hypothetical protein